MIYIVAHSCLYDSPLEHSYRQRFHTPLQKKKLGLFKINVSQHSKMRRKTDPVYICQQATAESMHPNLNRKTITPSISHRIFYNFALGQHGFSC